jgi:hypothetical protein
MAAINFVVLTVLHNGFGGAAKLLDKNSWTTVLISDKQIRVGQI